MIKKKSPKNSFTVKKTVVGVHEYITDGREDNKN